MSVDEMELRKLFELANRVHTNLIALNALATQSPENLTKAAQIISVVANMINDYVPIHMRNRRWDPSRVTITNIIKTLNFSFSTLARFVTTYKINPIEAAEQYKIVRNQLIAVGILSFSVLNCDNIQRALHGDSSRQVIALDAPTESPPPAQEENPAMKVQAHIKLERLSSDLRIIITNLQALSNEVKEPPFNPIEVAQLIGPILNIIAAHISLPPRTSFPNTSTSRQWIVTATKESLGQIKPLYAVSLHPPTTEEELKQLKIRITQIFVGTFITMRDIYLAPDVQQALMTTTLS